MDTQQIVEVHQLLNRYGHAVDHEDPEMIREIFAVDAVFDADPCQSGRYEGVEEIVRWFELGKPPHPPFHLTTNIYVYESNGELCALSKWLVAFADNPNPMSGDYQDRFVRENGELRILHRIASPRSLDTSWSSKVTF